ncbi:MAG TPA: FkbM family methyltransferase [Actinomycetota bacterium]|nr:FkbM family methyltransferase [Actinomycetota bacterium]
MIGFNKLCELEDFSDPELSEVIREVVGYKIPHFAAGFPAGVEHRKDWEVAMAVRSFDRFGVLRPDATLLGVGAGQEDTLFYLTRRVGQVVATDRYLAPGEWQSLAPPLMMVDPESVSRMPFQPERLVVQHMDGRWLRYADETFDGIFSCGSIEHFGEFTDVASSAYEMGRVLKPGGIVALSTEFRLTGPPGGIGWPGLTLLFSRENLIRHIVEASGLEPVDDLNTTISDDSLATSRNNSEVLDDQARAVAAQAGLPHPVPGFTLWQFPHIVLNMAGYSWGSVHITLQKTDRYPFPANDWAAPTQDLKASIRRYNRTTLPGPGSAAPGGQPHPEPAPAAATPTPPEAGPAPAEETVPEATGIVPLAPGAYEAVAAQVEDLATQAWERVVHAQVLLGRIDRDREQVDAKLEKLEEVARAVGRHLERQGVPPRGPLDPPSWSPTRITLEDGLGFTVVIDSTSLDPVSQALAAGHAYEPALVALMRQLVQPGQWVLDLGAHIGMFSLAASAHGCQVLALEASPTNVALLRSAAWRNGFHQLHAVNAVATDQSGDVPFLPDGPWGHVAWESGAPGSVLVPGVMVDDLLVEFGWGGASLVKIDVEGSEVRALGGMQRLLGAPDAPPVLFESNAHTLALAGTSPTDLLAAFEALGYATYLIDPGRFTRVDPAWVQPHTIVDMVALKRRPRELVGWVIAPGMSDDEFARRLAGEAAHHNPDCRIYAARTILAADPELQADPRVAEALTALRADEVDRVRSAAGGEYADAGAVGAAPAKAGQP